MTRKTRATRAELILERAASLSAQESLPASRALARATKELKAGDEDRKRVQDAFSDALVKCLPGQGTDFNRTLLEHAQRIVKRKHKNTSAAIGSTDKLSTSTVDAERKRKMTEDNTTIEATETENETEVETPAPAKAKKGKYNKGDVLQITSDMGLQPSGDGANIPFKFSRKTGKGNIDLAEGTDVTYDGNEPLFVDKPNTKRLIFVVAAGTQYTQDGEPGELDEDIKVGGVSNHVDPDDEYNLNRKRRAKEMAAKAKMKADAEAAAAKAKAEAEAEAEELMADEEAA